MDEVLFMRTAWFLFTFVFMIAAIAAAYVSVTRRKENLTIEEPNPGYRNAALRHETRNVSALQLLEEMPWSVGALYLFMALMSAGYVATTGSDAQHHFFYRSVMPRFDEVPEGHRGVVFDRFGGISDTDVREPGSHFVWSREQMALLDCSQGPTRDHVASAETSDGRTFRMAVTARVGFRCDQSSAWRVLWRRFGHDTDWTDAWFNYFVPAFEDAFEEAIDGRTARYVEDHRQEILLNALRRTQDSADVVSVDYGCYGLRLLGDPLPELPQPRVSDFELPYINGWSTSLDSGADMVTYWHHDSDASIAILFRSVSIGSQEDDMRNIPIAIAQMYQDDQATKAVYLGVNSSRNVRWCYAVTERDGNEFSETTYVFRSDRPGVNVMMLEIVGQPRYSDDALRPARDRIMAAVGRGSPHL